VSQSAVFKLHQEAKRNRSAGGESINEGRGRKTGFWAVEDGKGWNIGPGQIAQILGGKEEREKGPFRREDAKGIQHNPSGRGVRRKSITI